MSNLQILRMSGNYVRRLGQEVFKNAGLLNLQRIFMNNCHVQVGTLTILSLSAFNLGTTFISWSRLSSWI